MKNIKSTFITGIVLAITLFVSVQVTAMTTMERRKYISPEQLKVMEDDLRKAAKLIPEFELEIKNLEKIISDAKQTIKKAQYILNESNEQKVINHAKETIEEAKKDIFNLKSQLQMSYGLRRMLNRTLYDKDTNDNLIDK